MMTRYMPSSLGLALVLAVGMNAAWAQCPKECCQEKAKTCASCPACKNDAGCCTVAACRASSASPSCCQAGCCACCKAAKETTASACCAACDAAKAVAKEGCGAGCMMLTEPAKVATPGTTIIVIAVGPLGLPTPAMHVAEPIASLLPMNPMAYAPMPPVPVGVYGLPPALEHQIARGGLCDLCPPAPEPVPPPAVCAPPTREAVPTFTVSRPTNPPAASEIERTEFAQPALANANYTPSVFRAIREDGNTCVEVIQGLSRMTTPSMNWSNSACGVIRFEATGERVVLHGKQLNALANRVIADRKDRLVLEGNVMVTQGDESPTRIEGGKVTIDLTDGHIEIQSMKSPR